MSDLRLASPAFDDGEPIPRKYGYDAANVNPPLDIEGVPDEAESLALTMQDPDAKPVAGHVWDHWVVWNVDPSRDRVPEDWSAAAAEEGRNDFDEFGYGGPSPPDSAHTYVFRLYALDAVLDVPDVTTIEGLQRAMEGHVLAEAELRGTYAP